MAIAKTLQRPISPFKQASAQELETVNGAVLNAKPNKEETLIYTTNNLLAQRAQPALDVAFLAYPASPRGRDDYVHYTASDLDRFADEAVRAYLAMCLPVKVWGFTLSVFHMQGHLTSMRW